MRSALQGLENKGEAMEISGKGGWVMLGMDDMKGVFTPETGSEFAGTCLSDPSMCEEGLTLALWLKLCKSLSTLLSVFRKELCLLLNCCTTVFLAL